MCRKTLQQKKKKEEEKEEEEEDENKVERNRNNPRGDGSFKRPPCCLVSQIGKTHIWTQSNGS